MYANDLVNVRSEDNTESEIVTTINKGTELTVVEKLYNGWYKVILQNTINGYVSSEFIVETVPTYLYTDEDLYWLSHVIYAEAGSNSCSDKLQLWVGSVVLNRVKSDKYPNSIKGVIYDRKYCVQYACILDGNINKQPDERTINNAIQLLTYGSVLPDNVLGQRDTIQLSGEYGTVDGVCFSYLD